MLEFFDQSASQNTSQWYPRQLDYYLKEHRANHERVVAYYRRQGFAVTSRHLLVRILHTLIPPHLDNRQSLYYYFKDVAQRVSQAHHFTSATHPGKLHQPGVLDHDAYEEIILHDEANFDIDAVMNHPQSVTSVYFLRHPSDELTLNLPNQMQAPAHDKLVVIGVNLAMLAAQYHAWHQWQLRYNSENPRNMMQFIHGVIWPNMLASAQDLSLLNRYFKGYYGAQVYDTDDLHPFYLNPYSQRTQEQVRLHLKHLKGQRTTLLELVKNLHLIHAPHPHTRLQPPQAARTRQLAWALYLVYLPLYRFILHWGEHHPHRFDRQFKNHIYRALKRLLQDRQFATLKRSESFSMIEGEIQSIQSYL